MPSSLRLDPKLRPLRECPLRRTVAARTRVRAGVRDGSLALFVERGFAATRLDDVAERAGVSKGTVYLYLDGGLARGSRGTRHRPNAAGSPAAWHDETLSASALIELFMHQLVVVAQRSKLQGVPKLMVSEIRQLPRAGAAFRNRVHRPDAR